MSTKVTRGSCLITYTFGSPGQRSPRHGSRGPRHRPTLGRPCLRRQRLNGRRSLPHLVAVDQTSDAAHATGHEVLFIHANGTCACCNAHASNHAPSSLRAAWSCGRISLLCRRHGRPAKAFFFAISLHQAQRKHFPRTYAISPIAQNIVRTATRSHSVERLARSCKGLHQRRRLLTSANTSAQ